MLPPIQLESNSELPLYRQLYDQLRSHIQAGRLAKGERLPATRELAGTLGLNRATVAAAYGLLETDGLMKGHVGRGSFVEGGTELPTQGPWSGLAPLTEALPHLSLSASGISFASSRPATDLFPMDEFRASCQEMINGTEAESILQLGSPLGYAPLRTYLMDETRREGAASESDNVMITSGCQQALDLIQRVLIRPGDTVAIEDPVYPGLRGLFAAAGVRLVGVPVGVNGIDLSVLRSICERDHPRMLVITPNFQNPTGATIPLAARQAILQMARESGMFLIENDTYGALRYEGEPIPSIKQLDGGRDVVLLRSFSKVAFPGLRVGWVIAPDPLIARLQEAKQWCDLHSDQLSQAVMYRFAESGRLAGHKNKVIAAGSERLAAVLSACRKYLPPESQFTKPQGGMNLWVKLPVPLDAADLLPRAEAADVNYLPGRFFAVSHAYSECLRLSFAGQTPARIRQGVSVLGDVFRSELERARVHRRTAPMPALV